MYRQAFCASCIVTSRRDTHDVRSRELCPEHLGSELPDGRDFRNVALPLSLAAALISTIAFSAQRRARPDHGDVGASASFTLANGLESWSSRITARRS